MPAKVIRTSARFVRTAPDKIRNLAGLVKGKNITKALDQLAFAGKYAATPLSMVLRQAKAQIKDQNLVENDFTVSEMRVDEGPKLKRRRIRHQGRSTAILKRMSHITIILTEKIVKPVENKLPRGKANGAVLTDKLVSRELSAPENKLKKVKSDHTDQKKEEV